MSKEIPNLINSAFGALMAVLLVIIGLLVGGYYFGAFLGLSALASVGVSIATLFVAPIAVALVVGAIIGLIELVKWCREPKVEKNPQNTAPDEFSTAHNGLKPAEKSTDPADLIGEEKDDATARMLGNLADSAEIAPPPAPVQDEAVYSHPINNTGHRKVPTPLTEAPDPRENKF